MEEKIKEIIENKKKTYLYLEEIETIINQPISYLQEVNLVKELTKDGIIKPVRKINEW